MKVSREDLDRAGKILMEDPDEAVEKPIFQRLMENVHMQGFRNPEE